MLPSLVSTASSRVFWSGDSIIFQKMRNSGPYCVTVKTMSQKCKMQHQKCCYLTEPTWHMYCSISGLYSCYNNAYFIKYAIKVLNCSTRFDRMQIWRHFWTVMWQHCCIPLFEMFIVSHTIFKYAVQNMNYVRILYLKYTLSTQMQLCAASAWSCCTDLMWFLSLVWQIINSVLKGATELPSNLCVTTLTVLFRLLYPLTV